MKKFLLTLLVSSTLLTGYAVKRGKNKLHVFAQLGYEEKLTHALSESMLIDSQDDLFGSTPLHLTMDQNQINCAKILIAAKANVNSNNDENNTPLHLAVGKKNRECAVLLLQSKALVNVQNEHGATPLHIAASYNDSDIVSLLLTHESSLDSRNKRGNTPLHEAAMKGCLENIRTLILAGAPTSIQNNRKKNPLALAQSSDVQKTFDQAIKEKDYLPDIKFRLHRLLSQVVSIPELETIIFSYVPVEHGAFAFDEKDAVAARLEFMLTFAAGTH